MLMARLVGLVSLGSFPPLERGTTGNRNSLEGVFDSYILKRAIAAILSYSLSHLYFKLHSVNNSTDPLFYTICCGQSSPFGILEIYDFFCFSMLLW